jgi:hypothetical protein
LAQDVEFVGEVAGDSWVLALPHLFDGAYLSRGLGARAIDMRVAALPKQVQELIINIRVGESVVLDHLFEEEGRLLLGRRQGLLRPHLTYSLYINYSLTKLNNKLPCYYHSPPPLRPLYNPMFFWSKK